MKTAAVLLALCCAAVLAETKTERVERAEFVKLAKANATKDMKDPSAIQYRGLYVSTYQGMRVLCGELNGKNSYGGYVGFRQFFTTELGPIKWIATDVGGEPSFFERKAPELCGNKVADIPD